MFPINLAFMNDEQMVYAAIDQLEQQMLQRQFVYNRLIAQLADNTGNVPKGVRKAQKRLVRSIEAASCRDLALIRAIKEDIE